MVKAVREAESAIGRIDYSLTEKQLKGKDFSRSLYAVKDIRKGEDITTDNVKSVRPGFGLHPKYLKTLLGKKTKKNLFRGNRLLLDDILF